uniref:ATP synthase complex subunit 8 n=1 Tax=Phryganogryllacris superangulata TaxID=2016114 RepID=A0A9E8Z2P7_9ORTH|nr:ATP synthase F0 subunit 8 [Phryganogryllacris superangulata]WAL05829.1 ATP synthase F0 subunit 8 [Phryganogryllacris superangulata]
MPQMAPIKWLMLFIIFSITLMMFCMSNYFSLMPKSPSPLKIQLSQNSMNWKW